MQNCPNRHFAIILAAGLSSRMGTCKTALPWHNNRSLLRYQAEQFLLANITPIVVLGSHNAHRRSDCPLGSQVVINANSHLGKTTSILAGLDCLPLNFSSLIISAVDQPRSTDVYKILLQAYEQNNTSITALCCNGKLGHPLLFSNRLLSELKQIDDSTLGLREVVKNRQLEINKVNFSSLEIFIDLNYINTYRSELEKAIFQSIGFK